MQHFIAYNSEIIAEKDLSLNHQNRAFNYGDGIFESMIYKNGKICFWPDHYQRLMKGFDFMKFEKSSLPNEKSLQNTINELVELNNLTNAKIKMNVWRKEGGLYTPKTNEVEILIIVSETVPTIKVKDKVISSPYLLNHKLGLSNIKSCNSIIYVLSGIYALENNCQDALVLNYEGKVAELTSSNLFFLKNNTFITPSLSSGCLDGIMRKNVIRVIKNNQFELTEKDIYLNEITEFDNCFATNVSGIYKINQINNHNFENKTNLEFIENEIYR